MTDGPDINSEFVITKKKKISSDFQFFKIKTDVKYLIVQSSDLQDEQLESIQTLGPKNLNYISARFTIHNMCAHSKIQTFQLMDPDG